MKNCFLLLSLVFILILSCHSKKATLDDLEPKVAFKNERLNNANTTPSDNHDTIRIANDSLEYEVIIIDPGFNSWILSRAYPRGYHSQTYMETKNYLYVSEWNHRVLQPRRFNTNLYEMTIDYDPSINYGYEVNYLIYNYMIYFQNTYNQRLHGYVPRR